MTYDQWQTCQNFIKEIEDIIKAIVRTGQSGNSTFEMQRHQVGYGFTMYCYFHDKGHHKSEPDYIYIKDFPCLIQGPNGTIWDNLDFGTFIAELNILCDAIMKKFDMEKVILNIQSLKNNVAPAGPAN